MAQSGSVSNEVSASFETLRQDGFRFLRAAEMRPMLERAGAVGPGGWDAFAASWNDMPLDTYMGDGGRYRRRRFAGFAAQRAHPAIQRAPHAPHYQEQQYNSLNGGIARWVEPIPPEVTDTAVFRSILLCCRALFDAQSPDSTWHI